jgi:hypothetical protein
LVGVDRTDPTLNPPLHLVGPGKPARGHLALHGVELRQGNTHDCIAPLTAQHRPPDRPGSQRTPHVLTGLL